MKRLSLPGLAVGCVILFYEVYKFSKEVRKNNTKENSNSYTQDDVGKLAECKIIR